ncbi:MAG: hypothetical protein IJC99_03965 [Clostridia bacterium]|nr:hypothetical protein [Clostridia bacterium]
MAQCVTKMVLDVSERDMMHSVVARQGDGRCRSILLRLLSYGELLRIEENAAVVLNVKSANEQSAAFAGEVHADGSVTLPLTAWMLREEGVLTCDVSIFDEAGGKLTTPPFEIEVMASVMPDDSLPGDDEGEGGITAEIVQQERMLKMTPTLVDDIYFLLPEKKRHYSLDLSGPLYGNDEGWRRVRLELPPVGTLDQDNWIVISCHAPLRPCGAVPIDWGQAGEYNFVGAALPEIVTGDFDIICTFSNAARKWNVGVIQYAQAEAAV